MNNLIEIKNIKKSYLKVGTNFSGSRIKILNGVTFNIEEGSSVGLIGESGSGKSTLTRLIMGLEKPDSGDGYILIEGQPIKQWLKKNRGKMSVVFQDYLSSINPRYRVEDAIIEPIIKRDSNFSIEDILFKVGLDSSIKDRYPHELSGGQLQRVCIARAIITNPRVIILDEAISSLDVSVQFQILKLLEQLRMEMKITYLFVAHDLQAVTYLCNKIVFLNQGKIVEELNSTELFKAKNNYAKNLLNSVIPFEI